MKAFKLNGYSTWSDVMKNNKITDIQDPVLEMELDKQEFDDIYKEVLYELQGNDDVLESYVLSFRGEKEKNEFYDIGLKKESVLSLVEIHEGEIRV